MPSVGEGLGNGSPIEAALGQGLKTVSLDQEIEFAQYRRLVLPADGYVFWIRATLLTDSALIGRFVIGAPVSYNQAAADDIRAGLELTVKGSLHQSIDQRQGLDEVAGFNRIVFTTQTQISDMNAINPNVIYVGTYKGKRFAFSQQGKFYESAGLYHYVGDAVFPVMETQIIDEAGKVFAPSRLIVSNSLPLWLGLATDAIPLYPSFAVPENIPPAYGVIHIAPEGTVPLQAIPQIDRDGTQWQLTKDKVTIILYGLDNGAVMDFNAAVIEYMTNYDHIGLMNMPTIKDAKRTQNEFNVLAMKKVIEYEVSYYQAKVREVTRKIIESAFIDIFLPE